MCYTPIYIEIEGCVNKRKAVPCGLCMECLQKRRNDWVFRLMQEERDSLNSTFLTLTYNNENLPIGDMRMSLHPDDLTRYWKRVRKSKDHIGKIKYYAIGEYGELGKRPHYHAIVFNADEKVLIDKWNGEKIAMGRAQVDEVTEASIRYVTKYIINQFDDEYEGREKPFARMSQNLGMGYIKRTKAYHRQMQKLSVTMKGGIKLGMPRYYAERIFGALEQQLIQEDLVDEHDKRIFESDYIDEMNKRKYRRIVSNKMSKSKKC